MDGFNAMAGQGYGDDGQSLEEMDPELLEWLLQAYGGQLQGGEIEDKLAQARALRDTQQPTGRHAGRVYVSQNPLETIGATMQSIKGGREEKRLLEERRVLNEAQGDRTADYGMGAMAQQQALLERSQRGDQAPPAGGRARPMSALLDSLRGRGRMPRREQEALEANYPLDNGIF